METSKEALPHKQNQLNLEHTTKELMVLQQKLGLVATFELEHPNIFRAVE